MPEFIVRHFAARSLVTGGGGEVRVEENDEEDVECRETKGSRVGPSRAGPRRARGQSRKGTLSSRGHCADPKTKTKRRRETEGFARSRGLSAVNAVHVVTHPRWFFVATRARSLPLRRPPRDTSSRSDPDRHLSRSSSWARCGLSSFLRFRSPIPEPRSPIRSPRFTSSLAAAPSGSR